MHIKIEKLAYGGNGLGFIEKQPASARRWPVFVPMTVPLDDVEIEIVREHAGYSEARLTKILESSPNRTLPKCEYFGRCGGCQWQHVDYSTQILWKQLILEGQLVRIGKLTAPRVLPAIPSPKIWNYRNRIRLHKDERGNVGFFALGSHDVVPIKECLIAEKDIANMGSCDEDGFIQVNTEQNENLQRELAALVRSAGAKNVLELYCGNGNLTFSIAPHAEKVTATDSDPRSIGLAQRMADERKARNVCFMSRSAISTAKMFAKEHRSFDTVVLDPPRDGCKDIIKPLLGIGPKTIIYVSCNPSTLARDVRSLVDGGYELVSSQPIDMFPQTFHIESINLLRHSE